MNMDDKINANLSELAASMVEQIAERQDIEARQFLDKNLIPSDNIEEANRLLREKGMRLIDETQWSDDRLSQTHRLLLVKIVDQHEYKITLGYKIGGEVVGETDK